MMKSRLSESRVLRCAVRSDKQIAIFYKPTPETSQRVFVITNQEFIILCEECRDKHSMFDPILGQVNSSGFFIIEAGHPTIQRILRKMSIWEKEII